MTVADLYNRAYANAHRSADILSGIGYAANAKQPLFDVADKPDERLQHDLDALERLARELHSCAIQLAARCRGVRPPKNGD